MEFHMSELSSQHPIVLAAYAMVKAHAKHETMIPACEEVMEQFPSLSLDQVYLMWISINAKNNS